MLINDFKVKQEKYYIDIFNRLGCVLGGFMMSIQTCSGEFRISKVLAKDLSVYQKQLFEKLFFVNELTAKRILRDGIDYYDKAVKISKKSTPPSSPNV